MRLGLFIGMAKPRLSRSLTPKVRFPNGSVKVNCSLSHSSATTRAWAKICSVSAHFGVDTVVRGAYIDGVETEEMMTVYRVVSLLKVPGFGGER